MNAPQTITQKEAFTIASKTIHAFMPEADFVILTERTQEREFGWVFFYSPRRYLETNDPQFMVLGAGPLAVMRTDGSTVFLPTSVSPAVAIETFDQQWKKMHPSK